jgi:hypothetical protein
MPRSLTARELSDLVNLGKEVNSLACGGCPAFSSDGKYLFLQSWVRRENIQAPDRPYTFAELKEKVIREPSNYTFDIYWMDAETVEKLRPKTTRPAVKS